MDERNVIGSEVFTSVIMNISNQLILRSIISSLSSGSKNEKSNKKRGGDEVIASRE
jgi:hypothetical protein